MLKYFKENKFEVFSVFAISIFALILRFISLQNFGDLWVDELYSKYFASKNSLIDVVKTLFNEDFHTPLYFVMLHFWGKLFWNSDFLLRSMGLFFTVLTIPVSFYIVKDLFNKYSAYFVALFLSVSAFNIHYSVELRFYGTAILFAILSTYYFAKFVQNSDKTNLCLYSVFSLLLLYTFNFSFMYVFCQFLVGGIYLLKNKKSIKDFIFVYIFIAILYLPVIFMVFHNVLVYQTSILKFVRDIFAFDISCVFSLLLTIFSNIYEQFTTNDIARNYYYLSNLFTFKYLLFALVPILIGIFGLVRALKINSQSMKLFVYPSILLILIQFVLVFTHTMAFVLRYTVISSTLILIASVVGLTQNFAVEKERKNKDYFCTILCVVWFVLNSCFLFMNEKYSVLNRNIIYSRNLTQTLETLNLTQNDYVFVPRFGKLIYQFVPQGKHINIDTYDAFFLNNRPNDIEFIFGVDLSKRLNRKMAKTYLYDYIVLDLPLKSMQENLRKTYFSNMKKGQKFIIITDETLDNLKRNQEWFRKDINVYARSSIYYTLSAKILSDLIEFSKQDLRFKQHLKPSMMFDIYVFEKD